MGSKPGEHSIPKSAFNRNAWPSLAHDLTLIHHACLSDMKRMFEHYLQDAVMLELTREFPCCSNKYELILVSPRNYFLYTPLLPAVATGTVEQRSIVEPVRKILKNKVQHLPVSIKSTKFEARLTFRSCMPVHVWRMGTEARTSKARASGPTNTSYPQLIK